MKRSVSTLFLVILACFFLFLITAYADMTLRVQLADVTTGQTSTDFTFPALYERIRAN